MNCPYCNNAIDGPAKFCPNCGASLSENNAVTSPANSSCESIAGNKKNQNTIPDEMAYDQEIQRTRVASRRGKTGKKKKKKKRKIFSIILILAGVFLLLSLLSAVFSGSGNQENVKSEGGHSADTEKIESAQDAQNDQVVQDTQGQQNDQNVQNQVGNDNEGETIQEQDVPETWKGPDAIDYSIPLTALESGGYAYVTLADLDRYIVNMTGQNIYTVIQVEEVEKESIKTNIGDGFTYQVFETIYDYRDYFKEGDLVGIFGTVGETTEGPFNMDWTHVQNCQVFAYGDNAAAYQKETTDESMAGFLVLTEKVANSEGKNNISEDEFKSLCQYYPYEDILRNPDSYKNKYVVLSGTVDQTIEGAFGLYTSVYITDGNGDKWACTIVYKEGQSRLLQGDYVTVFGILDGTSTSTTLLGKQVSMPSIDIQYIE